MNRDDKDISEFVAGATLIERDSAKPDFSKDMDTEISKRNKSYTILLESYVNISKVRIDKKESVKWGFYYCMIHFLGFILLIHLCIITYILYRYNLNEIVSLMPIILSGFATLLTAFIAIPVAITKFLFNTDEDKYITDVIKSTQTHDATNYNTNNNRLESPKSGKNSGRKQH